MPTDHKKASAALSKTYFLFIQNYHACKMRCNYAGMNLPSALCEENKNKISSQVTFPMQLQNRYFKVVDWEGTATKCTCTKMHVQSVQKCLFSNLNMQTVDVLTRFPRRHGYLSSLQSFPHRPPLRFEKFPCCYI